MNTVSPKTGTVVANIKTPIQTIVLEKTPEGDHALYLDGYVQFVSGHDDVEYHGALATKPARLLGSAPFRALILGGGDGLAARNLLALPNCVEVVMIELDRGMLEFCSTHPVMRAMNKDVFRDPRLKAKVGDARRFVASQPRGLFELAVVDFPDPVPGLIDLYRWPFYAQLLRHMNPSRFVIAVQSSSANSPVEAYVSSNLSRATGCPCRCIRFKGRCMENGAITVASNV